MTKYTREQKITNEQRKEIEKRNELRKQIKAKYRSDEQPSNKDLIVDLFEIKHLTDKLNDDVESLLSSEQAWKAEAERVKGSVEDMFQNREKWRFAYEEQNVQLNQAIEVLKWIAECGTDYQSIQRARDFLSSLQEDKLPAPPEST